MGKASLHLRPQVVRRGDRRPHLRIQRETSSVVCAQPERRRSAAPDDLPMATRGTVGPAHRVPPVARTVPRHATAAGRAQCGPTDASRRDVARGGTAMVPAIAESRRCAIVGTSMPRGSSRRVGSPRDSPRRVRITSRRGGRPGSRRRSDQRCRGRSDRLRWTWPSGLRTRAAEVDATDESTRRRNAAAGPAHTIAHALQRERVGRPHD